MAQLLQALAALPAVLGSVPGTLRLTAFIIPVSGGQMLFLTSMCTRVAAWYMYIQFKQTFISIKLINLKKNLSVFKKHREFVSP